jgi:hypothetical protein
MTGDNEAIDPPIGHLFTNFSVAPPSLLGRKEWNFPCSIIHKGTFLSTRYVE